MQWKQTENLGVRDQIEQEIQVSTDEMKSIQAVRYAVRETTRLKIAD